jgi:2-dehydro-3-deoxyphosphogluconate aldolase / (4S)-4-hydroxy-2-oxoglutarate aldolase
MPSANIEQVANQIQEAGLVPVFYHADEEVCVEVVAACYKAGLRVFEFTNRGSNALANFKTIKKYVATNCPDMQVGAGTIFNTKTAEEFIDQGASFIVSPAFVPSMRPVQTTNSTLWIPGCGTISELAQARELGVTMMKVFPGDMLGPKFVLSALSVMPGLRLMPTGGVEPTEENLSAWFASGVSAVGMGSQLFSKDILQRKSWTELEKKVSTAIELIKRIRAKEVSN